MGVCIDFIVLVTTLFAMKTFGLTGGMLGLLITNASKVRHFRQ